jgi:hypothetical protein
VAGWSRRSLIMGGLRKCCSTAAPSKVNVTSVQPRFKDLVTDHIGPGTGIGHDYFYFPGDGFGYGFSLAVRPPQCGRNGATGFHW